MPWSYLRVLSCWNSWLKYCVVTKSTSWKTSFRPASRDSHYSKQRNTSTPCLWMPRSAVSDCISSLTGRVAKGKFFFSAPSIRCSRRKMFLWTPCSLACWTECWFLWPLTAVLNPCLSFSSPTWLTSWLLSRHASRKWVTPFTVVSKLYKAARPLCFICQ